MRRHFGKHVVPTLLSLACGLFASEASAVDKATCVSAFEAAQRAARDGALVTAADQYAVCAHADCPKIVRTACTERLLALQDRVPTVVFAAARADGTDVHAVQVFDGDSLVASEIDGRAVPVNPGPRVFRFVLPDGVAAERRVVVVEGEKSRKIAVEFPAARGTIGVANDGAASSAAEGASTKRRAPATERRSVPAGVFVLGGIGLAAIGSFSYFGLSARADEAKLRDSCAPNCAEPDVDIVRRKNLVSGISLGVGLAALGGATVWFFTTRSPAPVRAGFRSTPGGGVAEVSGAF
jgi:hypothetical protein